MLEALGILRLGLLVPSDGEALPPMKIMARWICTSKCSETSRWLSHRTRVTSWRIFARTSTAPSRGTCAMWATLLRYDLLGVGRGIFPGNGTSARQSIAGFLSALGVVHGPSSSTQLSPLQGVVSWPADSHQPGSFLPLTSVNQPSSTSEEPPNLPTPQLQRKNLGDFPMAIG